MAYFVFISINIIVFQDYSPNAAYIQKFGKLKKQVLIDSRTTKISQNTSSKTLDKFNLIAFLTVYLQKLQTQKYAFCLYYFLMNFKLFVCFLMLILSSSELIKPPKPIPAPKYIRKLTIENASGSEYTVLVIFQSGQIKKYDIEDKKETKVEKMIEKNGWKQFDPIVKIDFKGSAKEIELDDSAKFVETRKYKILPEGKIQAITRQE